MQYIKGKYLFSLLIITLALYAFGLTGPLLNQAWAVTGVVSTTAIPVPTVTATPVAVVAEPTPTVILDGQLMQFDVPPLIENGRTLVPLRAIFEAMGATVNWNEATSTVTATKGDIDIVLPIGSAAPTVNGKVWPLDVPAKTVNGRTLAPVRFVGEALGGTVSWDGATYTVTLTSPAEDVGAVIVNADSVNLRNGPGTNYNIVDTAHSGERLTVLGAQNGWYQVSRGGSQVWIAGWLVYADPAKTGSDPPATTPVVTPTPDPAVTLTPAPVGIPVVVLDAGHGGSDSGACGDVLQEKDVTLAVVQKVGQLLSAKSIKVVYTRRDDSYVSLDDRSTIANLYNAAVFVSVHTNACTNSTASGTETYCYSPPEDPALYLQKDERYNLALRLQQALVNKLGRIDRGVKEANLSVLRETEMPSALVEMAFITNPDEEALLQQQSFLDLGAQAIADAITGFMHSYYNTSQ